MDAVKNVGSQHQQSLRREWSFLWMTGTSTVSLITTDSVQETLNHSLQDLSKFQMITTQNNPSNVCALAKAT